MPAFTGRVELAGPVSFRRGQHGFFLRRTESILSSRVLSATSGERYSFSQPFGIAHDAAADLWVVSPRGGSVTELSPVDGSWIRTLSGSRYGFNEPSDIAVEGTAGAARSGSSTAWATQCRN